LIGLLKLLSFVFCDKIYKLVVCIYFKMGMIGGSPRPLEEMAEARVLMALDSRSKGVGVDLAYVIGLEQGVDDWDMFESCMREAERMASQRYFSSGPEGQFVLTKKPMSGIYLFEPANRKDRLVNYIRRKYAEVKILF